MTAARALVALLASGCVSTALADEVTCVSLVWAPYVDPASPGQGWAAQVAREAFAESGHDLTVEFLPWSRALMATRDGTYDCVIAIYSTDERQEWLHFSSPILASPVGFYARTDDQLTTKTLDELVELRLGVVRDYANVPLVDEDPRWARDPADTDLLNLRKLAYGRVDLIFIDFGTAHHLLGHHPQPTALQPLAPLGSRSLHVAFGRTAAGSTLHADFDQGLAELRGDGRLQALHTHWGLSPATGTP